MFAAIERQGKEEEVGEGERDGGKDDASMRLLNYFECPNSESYLTCHVIASTTRLPHCT